MINDLDFLKDTNLKELYHFSEKGEDPFLISLTGKKDLIANYKNKEDELEKEYDNEIEDINNSNKRYSLNNGIYYYNDGSRYVGEFKNGKRDGKGIYYYHTGNSYEGDWKDDKREGKGVYYYFNGDREMGDYLDNKEIGTHAVLKANSKVSSNTY